MSEIQKLRQTGIKKFSTIKGKIDDLIQKKEIIEDETVSKINAAVSTFKEKFGGVLPEMTKKLTERFKTAKNNSDYIKYVGNQLY